MTLLVGILAKDGVVIAADSALTMAQADGKTPTITDSHRKIHVLGEKRYILAGTGEVGLAQRAADRIERAWKGKEFTTSWTHIQVGTQVARWCLQDFQESAASRGGLGALLAFYSSGEPHLVEFAVKDFQPEAKTPGCWYVSMGSGQLLADAYLALIRRTAWNDGQPTLENAILAAWWVMQNAIVASPGFVGEPIDIAVLRKNTKGDPSAYLLTEDDLELHKERASTANSALQGALSLTPSVAAAPMPAPPSK
ncbi:MAG: hypothetical protein IT373_11970 [Polyangiaceae bacterium]|nr:hypothetical protein [Polyangiaceae bacterium]